MLGIITFQQLKVQARNLDSATHAAVRFEHQ
jgi:hypothetical protein